MRGGFVGEPEPTFTPEDDAGGFADEDCPPTDNVCIGFSKMAFSNSKRIRARISLRIIEVITSLMENWEMDKSRRMKLVFIVSDYEAGPIHKL